MGVGFIEIPTFSLLVGVFFSSYVYFRNQICPNFILQNMELIKFLESIQLFFQLDTFFVAILGTIATIFVKN